MRLFTKLFNDIDQTTKTNDKVDALVNYFEQASEENIIFAIALLTGNKPKRPVKTADLKSWAAHYAHIPDWLFEDAYHVVGDLAETISLIINHHHPVINYDLSNVIRHLQLLDTIDIESKKNTILSYWGSLQGNELFIFNKLITGNFRMGVSRQLVIKALARFLDIDQTMVAHRIMGKWNPHKETLSSLFSEEALESKSHQPYPFFLAYPLEGNIQELGDIKDWIIEAKLDGLRGQIIARDQELFIWSRGEDLLTDKFIEFKVLKEKLPSGTVIDGEIIPYKEGRYLGFNELQTRIGRKNITKKILETVPLIMVCYDLLEWKGEDIREKPLYERRNLLINLINNLDVPNIFKLSEDLKFTDWEEVDQYRQDARSFNTEGIMIKNKNSIYGTGRRRGGWWKWKTEPMTIDGVLIYAQSGHGRRANLFTDYTFALWDEEGKLLPFAKAYSGLTDKEIVTLDNWIKRNTKEKFGPVRSVTPHWVFEIAFEGIAYSSRHKSGIALRFPRILRWRKDKSPKEANSIEDLKHFLKSENK